MKNKRLILSMAGAFSVFALLAFVFGTKSFAGLVIWMRSYRTYAILIACAGLLSLFFGLFKIKIVSVIYPILLIVISLSVFGFLIVTGNSSPETKPAFVSVEDANFPLNKDIVRIAFSSDPHWGVETANAEARTQILKTIESQKMDAFFIDGDIVELGIISSQYELAIADIEKNLPTTPVFFAMGNHDGLIYGQNNFFNYLRNGEKEFYKRIDITPSVHVLVLTVLWDARDFNSKQEKWLKENLDSIDPSDTVIVMTHAYGYGSGYYSEEDDAEWFDFADVIAKLNPILEEYKVDLMVSGHNHHMEVLEKNGVSYCIIGAMGGYPDYGIDNISEPSVWMGEEGTFGYCEAVIAKGTMLLLFKDQDGKLLYTYSKKTN